MDKSQNPISNEEFYRNYQYQADKISGIEKHIADFKGDIKNQLDRIETQTTQTNGKVRTLQIWRGYITGGLAVLTVIVLPIFFWMLYQLAQPTLAIK